jgi:hypothetical protein
MTLSREAFRPGDLFRDFCLWDYHPVTSPGPGTLRQSAFLAASLARIPEGAALARVFGRIRDHWGPFQTVWGVKSGPMGLSWELYFYDYDREDRRLGIKALVECLPDLCPPALAGADDLPWFMMSVEFDAATVTGRGIPSVDLYFEGEGGTISAGLSEVWDGQSRQPKNDYRFYRSREDRAAILDDLTGVPQMPDPLAPGRYGEEVFVISRKSHSSAVYFSRATAAQTLRFARETGFDPVLTDALRDDLAGYAPYLFDLGVDYAPAPQGPGVIRRSAIYGVF